MESIGERFQQWRKAKGLTAREIKEKTGISVGIISEYENNKKQIGSQNLISLWRAYDLDITWILTGKTVKISDLTENEKELLQNFKLLPEREQIKWIGKIEEESKKYQEQQGDNSLSSQIG